MNTIFVSSTFVDMQTERDIIQNQVSPNLNIEARKYGQSISFCDLRWGIDTSEMETRQGNNKVLNVCFDEIDRCDRPMVVLLGYRYGWIPEETILSELVKIKSLQLSDLEKSITALEIEYGALISENKLKNTLFYFREIEPCMELPPEFAAESEKHKALLDELKERIRHLTGGQVKTYTVQWDGKTLVGTEVFANMLTTDLLGVFIPQWETYNRLSSFEKELYTHTAFLIEKNAMFRSRKALIDSYLDVINKGQTSLIIKGVSGIGKSTLFSHLATVLNENGWETVPFFGGLTQNSNTALDITRLFIHYFEEKLHVQDTQRIHTSEQCHEYLNELCYLYTSQGHRVVLMLDAADRLFPDKNRKKLLFIPDNLNDSVRFVMTCLPDLYVGVHKATELPSLSNKEQYEIIQGILGTKRKELNPNVIQTIINHAESRTPLYLSFVIQRLLIMNKEDFEKIHSLGTGIDAINRYQIQLIRECPVDLNEMSFELLKAASSRIGNGFVEEILYYIAISRYGLRSTDLSDLLGTKFNMLDFAHILAYMGESFMKRDDGRYDFNHQSIREGFRKRCSDKKELHKTLSDHFFKADKNDPIKHCEFIWHCAHADDKETLVTYISDLFESNNKTAFISAAKAMYEVILADDSDWTVGFFEYLKEHMVDRNICVFLLHYVDKEFGESKLDIDLKLKTRLMNLELAKKIVLQADTIENLKMLSSCYRYCGYSYENSGTHDKTLSFEMYSESLKINQKIIHSDLSVRDDLCKDYTNIGELLENEEDKRKTYEKAMKLCRALIKEQETSQRLLRLASLYDDLGDMHHKLSPMKMTCFKEALDLRHKAVSLDPTPHNKVKLIYSYWNLGKSYEEINVTLASEYYQNALDICEEVAESTKSFSSYSQRSYALQQLATMQLHQHDPDLDVAEKQCAEAVRYREIIAKRTNTPMSKRKLMNSLIVYGLISEQRSPKNAQEQYESALSIALDLREYNAVSDTDLCRIYDLLYGACEKQKKATYHGIPDTDEAYFESQKERQRLSYLSKHYREQKRNNPKYQEYERYPAAYVEVLQCVSRFPKEDVEKIPLAYMWFLKSHASRTHAFYFPDSEGLLRNLSREANAIIVNMYQNYFASDEEKENIRRKLDQNQLKKELRLKFRNKTTGSY